MSTYISLMQPVQITLQDSHSPPPSNNPAQASHTLPTPYPLPGITSFSRGLAYILVPPPPLFSPLSPPFLVSRRFPALSRFHCSINIISSTSTPCGACSIVLVDIQPIFAQLFLGILVFFPTIKDAAIGWKKRSPT